MRAALHQDDDLAHGTLDALERCLADAGWIRVPDGPKRLMAPGVGSVDPRRGRSRDREARSNGETSRSVSPRTMPGDTAASQLQDEALPNEEAPQDEDSAPDETPPPPDEKFWKNIPKGKPLPPPKLEFTVEIFEGVNGKRPTRGASSSNQSARLGAATNLQAPSNKRKAGSQTLAGRAAKLQKTDNEKSRLASVRPEDRPMSRAAASGKRRRTLEAALPRHALQVIDSDDESGDGLRPDHRSESGGQEPSFRSGNNSHSSDGTTNIRERAERAARGSTRVTMGSSAPSEADANDPFAPMISMPPQSPSEADVVTSP